MSAKKDNKTPAIGITKKVSPEAIKQAHSTESAKKEDEAATAQAEATNAQTPVGIDHTDPEQRKKDQDEAFEQNKKDWEEGNK